MRKLEYPTLTLRDGDKRYRSLEIQENGDFVFEQTDYGPNTARLAPNGGDSDYEYWIFVKSKNVNKVFLELIRDTFSDQGQFEDWLKNKGIEYEFDSY